ILKMFGINLSGLVAIQIPPATNAIEPNKSNAIFFLLNGISILLFNFLDFREFECKVTFVYALFKFTVKITTKFKLRIHFVEPTPSVRVKFLRTFIVC